MYCKNCGNYIEKGQARCSNCGNKQITTQKIIKRVLLILAIVVVYIVAFFMYIDNKYMNDSNSIKKILVGSAGNVLDENDHLNDIHIESEQQIENTFIYLGTWNEFSALADIDIGVGYLRNVQVVFRVPMFFFQHAKVDYCFSQQKYRADPRHDNVEKNNYTEFEYKVEPGFTGRDIMNYIGVYDSYIIAGIGVTSIANTYDSFEYSVLWQYPNDIQVHQDWVRAEFDYESQQWVLKDPTIKMNNILFSVSRKEGGFAVDTEYNPDDVVYIDLRGARIEYNKE